MLISIKYTKNALRKDNVIARIICIYKNIFYVIIILLKKLSLIKFI